MNKKFTKAMFAGSFDPITNGHLDIICRASKIFDELQIGVLHNPNKKGLFSFEERVELIKSCTSHLDNIRIEQAKKLLMEDNIKVYQVCEKVGYKNIDYFHSKFKKYVGVSPLNYKKQIELGKFKELV